MLKYQINRHNLISDKERINYSHFTVDDIDFIDETKVLVTCFYNDEMDIKVGSSIIAFYDEDTMESNTWKVSAKANFVEYEVTGVDTDERYFTLVADKYDKLKAQYMTVETVRTYEDKYVTNQEYEALSDVEKSRYSPYMYDWIYDSLITMAQYNAWENDPDSNDYAFSSYVECYKSTSGNDYISAWEYFSMDVDERSGYSLDGTHMILNPYIETSIGSEDYEQLMDYEKDCYVVSSYVYIMGQEVNTDYLYVYFEDDHYFRENSFIEPVLYFDLNDLPDFVPDENEGNMVRLAGGEVVNERGLRFLADENTEALYDAVKKSNTSNYTFSPSLSEYEIIIGDNENSGYIIARLEATNVYRENVVFPYGIDSADTNVSLFLVKHRTALSIPLTNMFSTDTYQETNIQENFVDVETEKAINKIPEMEKDVYHPVMLENNGTFTKIHEIRFNLHFREHRGSDWLVRPETFWNGVQVDDGNPSLMNYNTFDKDGFFSYVKHEDQSDLLSFLSFSNNDIKYQKNLLKKSFLRLSFYDSRQQSDQNLLCYSTVFMDAGNLFGKYTRNFQREGYTSLPMQSTSGAHDIDTRRNLVGIRVDREPTLLTTAGKSDEETIEKYRLSSQFTVKDKYISQSSSDGFYLYLWKDNDTGFTPSDIYLKVEFNHVGYGRTIPLMLPYNDYGIETFQQILSDWQDGNGYGIKKYNKFSYIHFKYKYDKESKRHVYYLDKEQYPNARLEDGGVLNINLWEAKVI